MKKGYKLEKGYEKGYVKNTLFNSVLFSYTIFVTL